MINENGQVSLTYRGIPVVKIEVWDRTIAAYQDNGTKWNLPHRAVLVTPTNLQVGTEEVTAMSGMDVFNDKKSKKNFIDFAFNIDAKVVLDYEIQVAY